MNHICIYNPFFRQQENSNKRRPLVLLRAAREHDLLLELDSLTSRRKFLSKLESFLSAQKKNLNCIQVNFTNRKVFLSSYFAVCITMYFFLFQKTNRDHILAKAETRERRQKRLEHFFREAYAITFGLAPGERRRRSDSSDGEVNIYHIIFDLLVY